MTTTIPAADEALDRRILDAAAALAAEGRPVSARLLSRELSIRQETACRRVNALRALGLWRHDGPPRNYRPTPAAVEAARAAACQGMGDGRGQVDDPREHGVLSVPSGGDLGPPPDLAATVRAIVREWKVRTGRVAPKAGPGARAIHYNAAAPEPYERTRHRHRSAWVSMDGKSRRIA